MTTSSLSSLSSTPLIEPKSGCAPLRPALTTSPLRPTTFPPTLPKSLAVTAPQALKRPCDASLCAMDNSNPSRSSSPSKRRHKEDDLPGQSASRTGNVVLSERTVLTATGSTKRTSSPIRHLTELRTARPSISATTRQQSPGSTPHNRELDTSIAQNQTAQISQSDINADASSSPVQQPQNHDCNNIPAGILTRTPFKRRTLLCGDVLFSLTPLFFLGEYLKVLVAPVMLIKRVLASLSLYLNHQSKSTFGDKVKATTLLSPTIFPIIYAAILGTALRRIGLYKAERSATVGVSVERRDLSIHSY
jgi:hypothetical protein